jgi:hypothetical protein
VSESGDEVVDFGRRMAAAGAAALSYTDVERDGTFDGPDIDGIEALINGLGGADTKVILAGGIGFLLSRAAGERGRRPRCADHRPGAVREPRRPAGGDRSGFE